MKIRHWLIAAAVLLASPALIARAETANEAKVRETLTYYTCRMHPAVHSDKPGKCPTCGHVLISAVRG